MKYFFKTVKIKKLFLVIAFFLISIVLGSCSYIDSNLNWLNEDGITNQSTQSSSLDNSVISGSSSTSSSDLTISSSGSNLGSEEISFHFFSLDNKKTGDSIYIKAGDTDILIDAGPTTSGAKRIEEYVDKYCLDNTLEYVIATHAHFDHIAGFVGTSKVPGIFDYYKISTLIDFGDQHNTTSKTWSTYEAKRGDLEKNGTKCYSEEECINDENGAKSSYEIADSIYMDILNNYYAYNHSSDENNYSVCTMFRSGDKKVLLTGDLEGEGEKHLTTLNDLGQVNLLKAGHHGSYTASTSEFIDVVKPKNVVFTCLCGTDEYTSNVSNMFPSQTAIDDIAKYTDKMYCSLIVSNNADGYESLNGDIIYTIKNNEANFSFSNSDTILKDTSWFKTNRVWPTA